MLKIISLTILGLLFLNACSHSLSYVDGNIVRYPTKDIKVNSKQYKTYSYDKKTYQWAKAATKINDPDSKWSTPEYDFESFTKKTIKQNMKKKGMKYSNDSADIIISFGIDINMAAQKYFLFGNSDGNLAAPAPKGALTIVVANKKSNAVIWTAWATADYKKLDKQIAKKRMEYAISEMLAKFPN